MRQRVLVILGMAVALLALYTLVFGVRPGGLQAAVATEAVGSARAAGGGSEDAAGGESVSTAVEEAGGAEKKKSFWDVATGKQLETWDSDPFVRDWVMVEALAELDLKAITIGGEKSYVLINDQILEEGDLIIGKRIVLIENDKIILEQGGRTFTLMLGE